MLEPRRLLAVAVSSGDQDGVDLVGTDASVGPDGVQDLHLHLTGLDRSSNAAAVIVQGTPGEVWAAGTPVFERLNGTDFSGAANSEFFPDPNDRTQGDLYVNPSLRSNLGPDDAPLG